MPTILKDVPLNRAVIREGVKTQTNEDMFTISCQPRSEIWEQQVMKMLKDWIRMRKKYYANPVDQLDRSES
jgi:hypothetical protein